MIDSSGELLYDADGAGVSLNDARRRVRTFRVTGGSNPYSAQEVYLDGSDGSTADAGLVLADTAPQLWELAGATAVAVGTLVVAFPNPHQQNGWYFQTPGRSPYDLIDSCLTVTKDEDGFVTDVTLTNTYELADGSIVCVDKPPGDCCDEWWCTETGVVQWPKADRATPPEGVVSGPYPVEELAAESCVSSTCPECLVTLPIPLRASFLSPTGVFDDLPASPVSLAGTLPADSCDASLTANFETGATVTEQGTGTPFDLTLNIEWTIETLSVEAVYITVAGGEPALSSQYEFTVNSTAAGTFTKSVPFGNTLKFFRDLPCDDALYGSPEHIGTVVLTFLTSEVGRFEVWLT